MTVRRLFILSGRISINLNSEVERWFHRASLIDFGFRWRVQDSTSAKLGSHRLRRFLAAGYVAAGLPRKRTDAGPSGGRPGRAEHRKGKLERATWPAGDRC